MANSNLKTLSEIFNDKIFRIPDYQRGYSWGESQLEDLWRDIDNLPLNKSHYTGMITVDIKDNKTYYVIDGQQRLTSLVIFLKNILDKYEDEWITEDLEKSEAIKKYLYSKTKNSKNPKIIFGYEDNNSSYYYYKIKILKIDDKAHANYQKTLYTENLHKADMFFKNKLVQKSKEDLENLFIKLTSQLKFNWYEIEKTDDLDEYVIFETMNNRGKPLSVLEILKNRLIYIVTRLKNDDEDKKKLRNDVNDVWKTIFENLGKDKRMDETLFLRYHVAMYWGTTEIKNDSFHRDFLLDNFFTVQKTFNTIDKEKYQRWHRWYDEFNNDFTTFQQLVPNEKNREKIKELAIHFYNLARNFKNEIPDFRNRFEFINETCSLEDYLQSNIDTTYFKNGKLCTNIFNDKYRYKYYKNNILEMLSDVRKVISAEYLHYDIISDYTTSLKDAIKQYYFILNPQKSDYDKDIIFWLEKLNILEVKEFMPILMSLLNNYKKEDKEDIISILVYIENYLFVKRYCWGNEKGQYLNSDYYKAINEYENIKNIEYLREKLERLIYGYSKGPVKAFNKRHKFIEKIQEKFEEDKGYYSWDGLKYVLYEYEISLQDKAERKVLWNEINTESIEHIYPQTPKDSWIDSFSNLKGTKQRKKYVNSLGNLLLLSSKKNSIASNKSFEEKKKIYSSGSFNEIEVSKYKNWTTKEIDERSEKILNFMNKRWDLGLKVADIGKLK